MNPIQSILVHVDAGPHNGSRLKIARTLGGQLGASVSALYAVTPAAAELSLVFTAGLASPERLDLDESRLAAARKLVADACADPGVQIEWREAGAAPEHEFMRQSLYADLLVLGQHQGDRQQTGVAPDFVQTVVIGTGKPALVVPCAERHGADFETVLVAWKESRVSARALSAAMPLLARAGSVHVAIDDAIGDEHHALLQQFLRRHDVEARFHRLASPAPQAGDALLSMAAEVGAGLMVMGCYGHSRGRELVLGGATRSVLQTMTLPVLMAH
ncbi:MAG: universal stress protein [Burkholderiaceae bacterium]|nr:universal stress protein [Burkholderiaceae bacterium]